MPNHADADAKPQLDGDEVIEIVLGIVVERHPALVAFDELVAEFPGPDTAQGVPESAIHDAIDELLRLGLTHCVDHFVFASYTAIRGRQLGV